jgi:hypothetical protein
MEFSLHRMHSQLSELMQFFLTVKMRYSPLSLGDM